MKGETMDISKVHILRVRKEWVGQSFPFDKVYLFHKEQEQFIPSAFTDCMVFPLTKAFAKNLWNVVQTDAEGSGEAFPMYRSMEKTLAKDSKTTSPFSNLQDTYKNYLAVVPTLFVSHYRKTERKKVMRKKKSFPMYMGVQGKPRSSTAEMALSNALSAKAYFLLEGKKIRPICGACPKHFAFLQGECRPGHDACYDYLGKTTAGQMLRNLKQYHDHVSRIDEPQIMEATDGELSANPS